jgi:hypothetical protein
MTAELPKTENQDISIESLASGLPPVESFLSIELPDPLPEYPEKSGLTSFGSGPDHSFDKAKIDYFAKLGVEIPPEWMNEDQREKLVNAFIILKGIYRVKDCQKNGGNTQKEYELIVKKWFTERIDKIGFYDIDESTGKRFDTYGIDTPLGGPNVSRQISINEFQKICNKIVSDLPKGS